MDEEAATRHVYTHPSAVEHWRHLVEIIALIVAAVWGFYVFVYQERIKPAAEEPNVDYHVGVDHAAAGIDNELITVRPAWRNHGTAAVQVDGYELNVYGALRRRR